ncbi:hypothetical protein [Methylobacter sp.]|uniref:hypothetical protein n=1 Tax=Methylobacter sp. TaxID=2051955 RepID=UPI00121312E6|nr:hypothetical protein [Methylobacter sp.]TAK59476.1 MAG: hypothetical protein EPO18_20145 [Methylobacter sp.]
MKIDRITPFIEDGKVVDLKYEDRYFKSLSRSVKVPARRYREIPKKQKQLLMRLVSEVTSIAEGRLRRSIKDLLEIK